MQHSSSSGSSSSTQEGPLASWQLPPREAMVAGGRAKSTLAAAAAARPSLSVIYLALGWGGEGEDHKNHVSIGVFNISWKLAELLGGPRLQSTSPRKLPARLVQEGGGGGEKAPSKTRCRRGGSGSTPDEAGSKQATRRGPGPGPGPAAPSREGSGTEARGAGRQAPSKTSNPRRPPLI